MKNVNKLKYMDYSLLCGYDEIPGKSQKGNCVFEAYENPVFHVFRNVKDILIPIGLCGECSGWSPKRYENYAEKIGDARPGGAFLYDQRFYVCMFNPECESDKFEDALTFFPAIVVDNNYNKFAPEEEKAEYLKKALNWFYIAYAGRYYDGMLPTSRDLLVWSYKRSGVARQATKTGIATCVERAEMISQVLNRYDINAQSAFAQDVLTKLYENTFIMLDKAVEKTEEQLKEEGLFKAPGVLDRDNPKLKKPKLTDKIFNKVLSGKKDENSKVTLSGDVSLSSYMEYTQKRLKKLEEGKREMIALNDKRQQEEQKAKEKEKKSEREKRLENFKL